MSLGTLYVSVSPRTFPPIYLAKRYGLDIKIVDRDAKEDATFAKDFPRQRVPTFKAADGFKLTEVIAINNHCMLDLSLSYSVVAVI